MIEALFVDKNGKVQEIEDCAGFILSKSCVHIVTTRHSSICFPNVTTYGTTPDGQIYFRTLDGAIFLKLCQEGEDV